MQPLPVSLRRDDVLHCLGYRAGSGPAPRIVGLVDETLDEARRLVQARGAYVRLPVERAGDVGLEPMEADALVVGLVTAGAQLEQRAGQMAREGHATRALIMDAAGSAAAEEAADLLGSLVAGDPQASAAARISCRISPGYGRWTLSWQRRLFLELPHAAIGVSLLPSMMMVPRKSVSFAMWLGADARPLAGLSGCEHCGLETCRYRRSKTA